MAGLRVLLRPARRDDAPTGPDRELWAARDPTGRRWAAASVLYTFNTDHQVKDIHIRRNASIVLDLRFFKDDQIPVKSRIDINLTSKRRSKKSKSWSAKSF